MASRFLHFCLDTCQNKGYYVGKHEDLEENMKRILSFTMALCLLIWLIPLTVLANTKTSGTCGENLTWSLNRETLTICGTGEMTDYAWGRLAPWNGMTFSKVVFEKGITAIGNYAFYGSDNLASAIIPSSVQRIGEAAFAWCTGLVTTIPDSVAVLEASAFSGCYSLTEITIPDSVSQIGERVFSACYRLTGISVSAGNEIYSSVNGVLFNKDQTTLICSPEGKSGAYNIPYGVIAIAPWAFEYNSGLTSVAIPYSVTSVGDNAFSNCTGLTRVIIPNSIKNIGVDAFISCDNLMDIFIPDSVNHIGTNAFEQCYNTTITGCAGSYAETYAHEKEIPFRIISSEYDESPGNVNAEDDVDAADALMVLQAVVGKGILTIEQHLAADVNRDGQITAADALLILQYATQKITVFPAA